MATRQPEHYWTYEDLFNLPDDGKRYEIIEGVLYELASPNTAHGMIIMNLVQYVLAPVVWALGGKILTAPLDVFLRDANPVQPDLLVLLADQLGQISKRGVEGPPLLLIEVLSPSNPEHDRLVKRALYARAGVPEYWIVSPEAALIEILVLNGDRYQTHARVAGDELLTSMVLPGISCAAEVVFTA
jgi:Uma2 family endonuclease